MKSAVIVFPGSNCDRDLAVALELVTGRKPAMVWHRETELPAGTDFIGVPGGSHTEAWTKVLPETFDFFEKYKTKKKMAQADGVRMAKTDGNHPVAYIQVQATDLGTTYIGYSFIDDNGDEVIYWFPYEMILDGDTGAIDYVPLA